MERGKKQTCQMVIAATKDKCEKRGTENTDESRIGVCGLRKLEEVTCDQCPE